MKVLGRMSNVEDFLIKPSSVKDTVRTTVNRVIGIMRKDPYAGPCEQLSESYGLKGQYCICKDSGDKSD
jgi:hypothetical protein